MGQRAAGGGQGASLPVAKRLDGAAEHDCSSGSTRPEEQCPAAMRGAPVSSKTTALTLCAAALFSCRQNVLGEKGRRIRELTSAVQKRFKFAEGAVELFAERVPNRALCAQAQVESLRYKLEGGLAVRRACNGVLRFIMENGAQVRYTRTALPPTTRAGPSCTGGSAGCAPQVMYPKRQHSPSVQSGAEWSVKRCSEASASTCACLSGGSKSGESERGV